jgi:hypothetical protein
MNQTYSNDTESKSAWENLRESAQNILAGLRGRPMDASNRVISNAAKRQIEQANAKLKKLGGDNG